MKLKFGMMIGLAVASLALGSCSTVTNVLGTTVSQKYVAVAVQAFDAVELSAAKYVHLPNCGAGQTTLVNACSDPKLISKIRTDVKIGRAARDSLWASAKTSGSVGATAAYNALLAATAAVKSDLAS